MSAQRWRADRERLAKPVSFSGGIGAISLAEDQAFADYWTQDAKGRGGPLVIRDVVDPHPLDCTATVEQKALAA